MDICKNKKIYPKYKYLEFIYSKKRKTYLIYSNDEKKILLYTAGKKLYDFLNSICDLYCWISSETIELTYNSKKKTYKLKINNNILTGKKNIDKFLKLYNTSIEELNKEYDKIKDIKLNNYIVKDRKTLLNYLDKYFYENKKDTIDIRDIPTKLKALKLMSVCRGISGNKYSVVIDHDLAYISKI